MNDTRKIGQSDFEFGKRGLLVPKKFWDFAEETSINGFEISGTEPPETARRIIFKMDDALWYFVDGRLDDYKRRGDFEDVIKYGNTVAELLEIESVPEFIDKKVTPIIALYAAETAPALPKIKIAAKVSCFNDRYTAYKFSPVYDLAENARIISAVAENACEGHATANVEARILTLSGWTDWEYLPLVVDKIAQKIQFRTLYKVTTLDGTDISKITSIKIKFTSDAAKNQGETELISKIVEYPADLHTCYLLVSHDFGANLRAYALLMPEKSQVEGASLENLPQFILQDTLHVEAGEIPLNEFFYDTQTSRIDAAGENLTASFEYIGAENWQEMTPDLTQDFQTRFTFSTLESGLRMAAVKIVGAGVRNYIAGFAV